MALEAGIEISDRDMKKLMRQFQRLPDKVARQVSRKAVNAGATPVVRQARKEVPVREGILKRSMGKRSRVYKNDRMAVAIIGARISGKHRGFHAHLVHDGFVAKDGSLVKGNPFLKRAVDASEAESNRRLREKLFAEIDKAARQTS